MKCDELFIKRWDKTNKNFIFKNYNKNLNTNYYKSLKDKKSRLMPFKVLLDKVGAIRYSPATVQEWKNSIYTYNPNYMKNLPAYDINVNNLIKKYFSLYFKRDFFKTKHKSHYSRKKRNSLRKIYVSKAEVKHTNSKALINIFVFNREKKVLLKNIRMFIALLNLTSQMKNMRWPYSVDRHKKFYESELFVKWVKWYYPYNEKNILYKKFDNQKIVSHLYSKFKFWMMNPTNAKAMVKPSYDISYYENNEEWNWKQAAKVIEYQDLMGDIKDTQEAIDRLRDELRLFVKWVWRYYPDNIKIILDKNFYNHRLLSDLYSKFKDISGNPANAKIMRELNKQIKWEMIKFIFDTNFYNHNHRLLSDLYSKLKDIKMNPANAKIMGDLSKQRTEDDDNLDKNFYNHRLLSDLYCIIKDIIMNPANAKIMKELNKQKMWERIEDHFIRFHIPRAINNRFKWIYDDYLKSDLGFRERELFRNKNELLTKYLAWEESQYIHKHARGLDSVLLTELIKRTNRWWYRLQCVDIKSFWVLKKRITLFFNQINLFFIKNINIEKNKRSMGIYFRQLSFKFHLNKYKFERKLLYRLGIYLKKIYKKRIEFNIINLKSINFNIDILTSALTLMIRRRRTKLQSSGAGWESLKLQRNAKYPIKKINDIRETMYEGKIIDMSVIENNYRNLNINELIYHSFSEAVSQENINKVNSNLKDCTFNSNMAVTIPSLSNPGFVSLKMKEWFVDNNVKDKDDILNKSLLDFYNGKNIEDYEYILKKKIKDYKNIYDIIFNKVIKYKNLGGMKFEISGRLTRRYRADRAMSIRRLFGGLNNIDASFKRKSSVILRGSQKSNVEYSLYTAKRRIGAFAVKGWISGRYYSTTAINRFR